MRPRGGVTAQKKKKKKTSIAVVHNQTQLPLKLKDFYVWDVSLNSGYYGSLQYLIPPGANKSIPFSLFIDKLMEERRPQQLHVRTADNNTTQTLLVLDHQDFGSDNNQGADVFLEMGDDGLLAARFVRREELAGGDRPKGWKFVTQRFWGNLLFLGAAGCIEEAHSVAPALLHRGLNAPEHLELESQNYCDKA